MKTLYVKNKSFDKKQKLNNKIGLGLSITILALVVLALVAVFCDTHTYGNTLIKGAKGDHTYYVDPVFYSLDAGLLGYFHFTINIFIALIAIADIVEFALIRKGKLAKPHDVLHVLNFAQVSCLVFNFLFTLLYLVPICCTTHAYNYEYLFTGSNLIFNFATPILASLLYIFCFKGYSLKNKWLSLLAAIPTIVYFAIYTILAFAYSYETKTDVYWDFYHFGTWNKYLLILMLGVVIASSCGVSIGLWKLNKIANWNRAMLIAVVNIFLAAAIIAFSGVMFKTNLTNDRFIEGLGAWQTVFMRFMFFTHLSNWWVGATCIIYSVYAIRIYQGKIKNIPIWAQIMRLAGVAAISITLIMQLVVSASYMINATNWHTALTEAYIKCFRKHLLFAHFATPFLVIVSFIVLEHTDLRWKHILHAASPIAIYTFLYAIVVYSTLHIPLRSDTNPRWVSPYDIYNIRAIFGSIGKYIYWALPIVAYAIMLLLNWVFWYFNRKIHFDKPKKGSAIAELKRDWARFKQNRK